ncbi:hypothetical protein L6452_33900 [Arctium lappa]|uniref:Uncharacterized protein n=1 Tax=Arctium lappa TaxID=4217 RepID=A0ACB8YHX6_ARCLA|nr:hypothetical protein L6452_33900 [Arctium lappa]
MPVVEAAVSGSRRQRVWFHLDKIQKRRFLLLVPSSSSIISVYCSKVIHIPVRPSQIDNRQLIRGDLHRLQKELLWLLWFQLGFGSSSHEELNLSFVQIRINDGEVFGTYKSNDWIFCKQISKDVVKGVSYLEQSKERRA